MGKIPVFAFTLICVWTSLGWSKVLPNSNCETLLAVAAPAHPLDRLITYRPLSEPAIANKWRDKGLRHHKVEVAEIMHVDNPEVQSIIDFVQARGGQVRHLKTRIFGRTASDPVRWVFESPYFWVNLDPKSSSYLVPVIGIDLTQPGALPALAHEFEHFKIWWYEFQKARLMGLDFEAAMRASVDRVWQDDMIEFGERQAVEAEMATELKYPDHPFNAPLKTPAPNLFWQKNYVNRVTYPEFQAVRSLLKKHGSRAKIELYMDRLLDVALQTRQKALAYLPPGDPLVAYWRDSSILELLIQPYGEDRLVGDRTLGRFRRILRKVFVKRSTDINFSKDKIAHE